MLKRSILASALLLIFLCGTVGCKQENDQYLPALSISNEEMDEINATVTLADQTKKDIAFSKTEENVHIYLDENKNEYHFNSSDQLISYSAAIDLESITKEPTITQEKADEIARDHIADTYGKHILDSFILKACNKSNTHYDLQYIKCFGKDGFINGELCVVWVNFNGAIDYSNVTHAGSLDDFNEALLKEITEETLQTFAIQQASKAYPDQPFTCDIQSIWLNKDENNSYYLNIFAVISGIAGSVIPVEYTYPL